MKVADLGFPPSSSLTFNPDPAMPVCPDSQLGPPPTTNSIPVPTMLDRCPDSLIGNGTAVFGLAQSTSPTATRDGEILIFNGGLVGGLPKIKIYAYSYDTSVGIYTESILQPDGQLLFDVPRLTSDSSVRTLNLAIPSEEIVLEKPLFDLTVTLPAGLDPTYVQAKCEGNAGFPWTAGFVLGSRDAGGNPTNDSVLTSNFGNAPCTGAIASARVGSVVVSGPAKVKRNSNATYKVKVRNSGTVAATGVKVKVSGRGIVSSAIAGTINPGATKTVNVRVKPKTVGRIKATFTATSTNAGSKSASKTITVTK
ncbi:MAG: CARDB domain-containing protein [Solirubrobacterales bacterium]